jgi:hypothetical protein
MAVTAALFMAAALVTAQAETPASPPPSSPSVVVPPEPSAAPAAQPSAAPAAQPAVAQPAPGATGAPVVSTAPQDDLDAAPSVRPYETADAPPAGPIPYETPDAPAVKTSVKVEEYHRSYEGPQDAQEASYDAGVKGAFDAQQALRGRLEGMWIVSAADGAPLLSLVISDPGRPDAPPGGAWRDLSRAHDPDGSGLIDQMVEEGGSVIMQIRLKTDAPPATLRLTASADGRWRGLLLDGGKPKPVVMDRKAI